MKILYIDNRRYKNNADIHIDFISSLEKNNHFKIIGYGNYLEHKLSETVKVIPRRVSQQVDNIIAHCRPDAILTYNCNGSGYEIGRDNINLYKWVSDKLSSIDIPKFHITTDYLRDGFRKDQAEWFEYVGYNTAIFRTKDSLKYPLKIKKALLPFSIDKNLYLSNIENSIDKKNKIVGFIGTSYEAPSVYKNRIMAMEYLRSESLLRTTKYLKNYGNKRLFGKDYINFLTNNLFNLTCGGTCNYFTAKHFQIPAANSMLVCADTVGLEDFPNDTYIKYDIKNLDNLLSDIEFHLNNLKVTKEKIKILHNFVIKNHNNYSRGLELKEIMKEI
tara:strand:- start:20283 stop:21275 length:993 start_codon:yes stop_codon:yes gene_type:complete